MLTIPTFNYNPANWYWIVGGSTTQVWSSAAAAYVPVSDTTYITWLDSGNLPSRIDTEANLQAVFEAQYPAGWPQTLAQQAQTLLAAKLALGIVVTCTGNSAVSGTYALDSVSTAQVFQIGTFANSFGFFPSGQSTQLYPDQSGSQHTFTVAQFVEFLKVVAALTSSLATQTGVMANGGTPAWPPQTATIA